MTETLSPVADLGQDKKEENGTASNGKKAEDEEKYDTLELRNRSNKNHKTSKMVQKWCWNPKNRTVTETLSPVEDLGQDKKDNEDEPDAKKQKFDTLSLRNRDVTETLSPLENWTKNFSFSPYFFLFHVNIISEYNWNKKKSQK